MLLNMLYDSEAFVVVYVATGAEGEEGYELVDKRDNTYVFLHGDLAGCLRGHIKRWQENAPCQEEVEKVLNGYSMVAYQPLVIH